MILQTPRLTLRPFTPADFADTLDIYRNPETCRYLLHGPLNREEFLLRFQDYLTVQTLSDEKTLHLAVVWENGVIGDLSLRHTGMKDTLEVGYVFHQAHHGQGFAREALSALLRNLFLSCAVHRVQAILDARNTDSARLCEAVGMRQEAHFLQDYWSKGEWTDTLVYACLKEDIL